MKDSRYFDRGSISRGEWLWVFVVSIMLLLLSSLPYLAGYHYQTPDQVFNGAAVDRADYAAHLAAMQLGRRGEWRYRFLFTSEPQTGAFVKQGYIFLGHVARWTGAPLAGVYHAARLGFGLLALGGVYWLAAEIFSEQRARQLAFLLATFGSGLGAVQLVFGWVPLVDISPIDFWLIDGYIFFSLLAFPHLVAAIFLITGMLAGYLRYSASGRRGWVVWITLCGGLLAWFQPYAPLLPDLLLGGMWLLQSRREGRVLWGRFWGLSFVAVVQLPLLVYNAWWFSSDAIFHVFTNLNVTLSPPLVYYLWGYGLLWPLALLGLWGLRKQPSTGLAAMGLWSAAALVLAYLPWNLQRRYLLAYSLPLGFLGAEGLTAVVSPWLDARAPGWLSCRKMSLLLGALLFVFFSSLYLSLGLPQALAAQPAHLYDPAPLVEAVEWLAEHAQPDEGVFTTFETGEMIAPRAGLPVFVGHRIETTDFARKDALARAFFSGELTPTEAELLLRDANIHWVLFGSRERALGESVLSLPFLTPRYQNGDTIVFQYETVPIFRVPP